MSLEIRTTPALIGINTVPLNLELRSRNAVLDLHHNQAKINIHTELPKIIIDQYDAFASAGLKNFIDLTKETADRARQRVMETIANKVADGHMLGEIEHGGNAIASIAKKNSVTVHEFGIDYIPKAGPKIDVTGEVKIEPDTNSEGVNNGVEGDFTPGSLDINFTPAQVELSMKQYNSIDIKYIGNNVDISI